MNETKPVLASPAFAVFLAAVLVVTLGTCSESSSRASSEEPKEEASRSLDPALEAFLREPPRLPEGLRALACRTWRERIGSSADRREVREDLSALAERWRREGLLFEHPDAYERALELRLAEVRRRSLVMPAADPEAVLEFSQAFLDPRATTARRALRRDRFEASRRLAELEQARAAASLALAIQAAGLLTETGWKRLETAIDAESKRLEQAFRERYVAPYESAQREFDRAWKRHRSGQLSRAALDRVRHETRQREKALWAARGEEKPSWRRLFELAEADWTSLSERFGLEAYAERSVEFDEALGKVIGRVAGAELEAVRDEVEELRTRERGLREVAASRAAWVRGEEGAGASLRETLRIALAGLERLRRREEELVRSGGGEELSALRESIEKVQRHVDELASLTSAALRDLSVGVDEEIADVEAVLAADPREATAALRQDIARDLFQGDAATLRERIAGLAEGTTLYQPLSDEARSAMLVALERHEQRQGGDDPPDPEDPARARQQKWGDRIQKVEAAAKAAHDVTLMLVTLGVVDVEDANHVLRGLDGVHAGLTILTGLTSGNPFDVISGTTQLVMILSGKEPPPSPEEVRHEQVMEALELLAEGQQRILESLQVVSDQIHALHVDLDELQQIARSTHQLLIDAELQGLRKAQEFERTMVYYAPASHDEAAASGSSVASPGFADWEQMRQHFQKHRDEYRLGRRFLDDQVAQEPLEILRIAKDPEQARELERRLGRPAGWLKSLVIADEQRLASLRQFVDEVLDPELRPAILGSLVTPVADSEALVRKLERLATREPLSSRFWREAYGRTVERAAWELENPILVADLAESLAALQSHRLLGALENGALPPFDELLAPGFDPSTSFGLQPEARFANLVKPLVGARGLLERSIAQSALLQGDVLVPILAYLALSDEQRFSDAASALAERVLRDSPLLRHNALRFLVHVQLHEDDEGKARIRDHVLALLREDVRATHFETILLAPVDPEELRAGYGEFVAREALSAMFFPGRQGTSNRSQAVRIDRRFWNEFGKMVYGLDLRVIPPLPGWETELEMEVPDAEFGSPAVVFWLFKDETAKEGARMLPLRLPGKAAAHAGELLESDAMPLLRRARAKVRSSLAEMALAYAPADALEPLDLDRLRRESWLRALYRVTW